MEELRCFSCKVFKPRTDYTKNQLKKVRNRKCKDCVQPATHSAADVLSQCKLESDARYTLQPMPKNASSMRVICGFCGSNVPRSRATVYGLNIWCSTCKLNCQRLNIPLDISHESMARVVDNALAHNVYENCTSIDDVMQSIATLQNA